MKQVSTSLTVKPVNLPSPVDFNSYVRAVNEIPMLSEERERDLVHAWHANQDRDAARELVLSHLRLVTKVVKDHRGYGLSEGDLAQEGTVGLMKAVKGFDPAHGVRLAAYAVRWIEAEIREYIFRSWRMVRLGGGATMKKLFFGYRKTMDTLRKWSPDRPIGVTHQEVASALGVPEEDAAIAMGYFSGKDYSLAPPGSEEDEAPHQALMASASHLSFSVEDDPALLAEESHDNAVGRQAIALAWKTLDKRSQEILKDRRLSVPPVPLREVAEKLSVSIERVRQLELAAWNKWVASARSVLSHHQLAHEVD